MPKGGYKIIDCKKIPTGGGQPVPGIYDAIESANGKPILIENLFASNREYNAMWVNFSAVAGNFEGPLTIVSSGNALSKIVVKPNDAVHVLSVGTLAPSDEPGVSEEDGPSASM